MFVCTCGVCASVYGCVQVCAGVHRYAWVCAGVCGRMHGVRGFVQVFVGVWAGVCACEYICMGVCGSAQVCVGVREFSEFLPENRVLTSADFNCTYPIQIFLFVVARCEPKVLMLYASNISLQNCSRPNFLAA